MVAEAASVTTAAMRPITTIHIVLRAGAPSPRVNVVLGWCLDSGEDGVVIGGRYLKGSGLAKNMRSVSMLAVTKNGGCGVALRHQD